MRTDACPAPGCAGVHSYTDDALRWCWPGDPQRVIDVERVRTPPPHLLRRLPGSGDFWHRWTRLEAVAKLTDTPALVLVADEAHHLRLGQRGVVETHEYDGYVVTFGWWRQTA